MSARSLASLAAIVTIVVVLGVLRSRDSRSAADPENPTGTSLPAVLDFGKGECVSCKKMMPVLDAVREAYHGVVDVRYYDLSEEPGLARSREMGVRLIPTQIFVAADGSEMFRHEGFLPLEEIEQKFEELGWTSPR